MTSVKLINHSSSTADWNYLQETIAKPGEIVDNSHCFFVDIMADIIYPAPINIAPSLETISDACFEYSTLWNVA